MLGAREPDRLQRGPRWVESLPDAQGPETWGDTASHGSVFRGGQCAAGFPLGRTSDTLTAQRASLLQLILKDN